MRAWLCYILIFFYTWRVVGSGSPFAKGDPLGYFVNLETLEDGAWSMESVFEEEGVCI